MPDSPASARGRSQGFTLVELIVVVAIAGILLTVGVPTMNNTVLNQRVKTATFQIYSSLVYARSEAIKRNANVAIVPPAGGWADGWTVQLQADGTVLRRQKAFNATTINGLPVTYQRSGRLPAGGAAAFTIVASGSSTVAMRCITVGLDGRPNIKIDQNMSGACNDD